MKNIHISLTYQPSRLQKTKYGHLFLDNKIKSYYNCTPQHIYITNDEEIKPNDWYENNGVIFKADTPFDEGNNPNNSNPRVTDFNKKIILTTDPQLIEDGIQAIDDEFLEWFIKNPSCEEVIVEIDYNKFFKKGNITISNCYEIIIPKEEPKQENCCTPIGQIKRYMNCVGCDRKPQQETLEQAYQRGYERGLNALIPLIENLNKEIIKLKRKGI
jgi:hypothetical protein